MCAESNSSNREIGLSITAQLTVASEALSVASLPGRSSRPTNGVVSAMTLDSEATVLSASRRKASSLAVLVDGIADPVDARIVTNGDMVRVNEDNLVVFVGSILIHPV